MSDFWTSDYAGSEISDPKRKFRFKIEIGAADTADNFGTTIWFAKTCTKPSFQMAAAEHKYLNHTFYFPGTVTWQDVTMTLVDPGGLESSIDVATGLSTIMEAAGYIIPSTETTYSTVSKSGAVTALGSITITQMNGVGVAVETWTLQNAFVTEIKYGDLEYGADDLTELTLTLKYDWATLNVDTGSEVWGRATTATEEPVA